VAQAGECLLCNPVLPERENLREKVPEYQRRMQEEGRLGYRNKYPLSQYLEATGFPILSDAGMRF
jgi:hypothetical protein